MLETAMSGDRVMMIWLSKQYLGMTDSGINDGSEEDNMLPWTTTEEKDD